MRRIGLCSGALLALMVQGPGGAAAAPPSPREVPAIVTALTVFAGLPSGLWRSNDWGAHWHKVRGRTSGASLEQMGAVRAIQCQTPRVWVASDGGVFLSADMGETWRQVHAGAAVEVRASDYYPADPTVLLGTASGLYRSGELDGGFSPAGIEGIVVHRLAWPGPTLVAATGAGIRLTDNVGRTWREPESGWPGGEARCTVTSSFFATDPVLFAGLASGVYRSRDGGRSWTPSGLQNRSVNDLFWFGLFLYAATDGGLFRSGDAGASWEALSGGLRAPLRATRVLFPLAPDAGNDIFLGTDDGMWHSLDGGSSWQTTGLKEGPVLAVATFPAPPAVGRKRR